MVKKEVFKWIRTGQKNIELRRGRAKKGDTAVFQYGRIFLRRKIIKREEGKLTDVLREDNYKNIIPSANTLEEAINYIKKLYGQLKEYLQLLFYSVVGLEKGYLG